MPKAPLFPRVTTISATTTDDGFTDVYLCDGTFTLTLQVRPKRRPVSVININTGTITVASVTGSVLGVSSLAGQYTAAEYAWNGTNFYAKASTAGANAFALNGVTAGTVAASKALVPDSNKDLSALRNLTLTNLDAGASGTAGSVDIFPTTASKGKAAITVTDQTGDTTVSLVVGAMAAARAITLADPLGDADILTGKMAATARTATSDGLTTGTIADAGLMQFIAVTSASANNIIVLPTPTPGRIVILYVGATGFELRSSAPATVAINGGTGSAAESAIGANMMVVAICTSALTWHGFTVTAATLAAIEAAAP